MLSGGQEGHWDKTYTENPAFFGEESSEFARTALNLFRSAGVRSVLELGCGHGRDALLFAKEGVESSSGKCAPEATPATDPNATKTRFT